MGARLGQHLLRDERARDDVAGLVGAAEGTKVLEIGPGRGALTGRLTASGAEVTAIELDDILAMKLPGMVGTPPNLTVLNEDFLRVDLASLGAGPWLVAGNLPYAVGTPILQKLLLWDGWTRAVLMFQKEVALRVCAEPGGADYGLLSLSVKARARAVYALDVTKDKFAPPPKVDSGVVVLTRLEEPRLSAALEPRFWTLAKLAFAQRRKMASSVLAKALGKSRADVDAAFAAAGVRPDARPETVAFESWVKLAETLG